MDEDSKIIVTVDQILPEELFIIPIRFRPVFPGMITPLVISPGPLVKAVERIMKQVQFAGLILQKDDSRRGLDTDNMYKVGTAVKIIKKVNLPDGGLHLLINTLSRFVIKEFKAIRPYPIALVDYKREKLSISQKDKEMAALTRAVLTNAKEMAAQNTFFTEEMKLTLVNVDEPGKIADFVASMLNLEKEEYQEMLETFDIKSRLEKTLQFIAREMDLIKLQKKIQGQINEKIDHQQKEYYLREQLKAIRSELGIDKSTEKDADYYRARLEKIKLSEEVKEKALEEVEKLEYVNSNSSEYGVIRNYLDTILELPWETAKFESVDIKKARMILNKDHYGLEDVKERIIEYLAVRQLRKSEKGSIICLVGPPGVGKTSVGKSIARAMNKKFFRFSLGGMRDEAEIKGHRRTYVGAMPGKVIQALKVVKSKNLVLMLDEIDKLGVSFQGDPASALLEVLDPEQNSTFRDHFLDLPFDLSQIIFITTANALDTIPGPLLDRMELIRLAGYILEEKIKIAQRYIIPRAIEEMGLNKKAAPKINISGLKTVIDGYSREAGVRSMEKNIKKIYRKAATAVIEEKKFPKEISEKNLKEILGPLRFVTSEEAKIRYPGNAIGLAWTSLGGATLTIESRSTPGRGRFKLTGQLGKVMNESAEIALTYVKSLIQDEKFWARNDIHIHVPDGATPKDGPSAGITITTALLSLYRKKIIKQGFGMTGEIRLTGQVLPIGGLKEKVIAARRIGLRKVIFPKENLKDWDEIHDALKQGMKIFPVEHYSEVQKLLF
ncbi:MAG: endopeptidase La [Spirochaetia bacterium]|nr:endopeptidase La [Spirochaetia bacterium]